MVWISSCLNCSALFKLLLAPAFFDILPVSLWTGHAQRVDEGAVGGQRVMRPGREGMAQVLSAT